MRHRFRMGLLALALAAGGAFACPDAAAQTPFPSFAYIVGRANGVDFASDSEIQGPDGRPDGWLRLLLRSPGYYIAEATGKLPPLPPDSPTLSTAAPIGGQVTFGGVSGGRSGFAPGVSGYHLKSMTLRHKTVPGLRWDTIPGNNIPLLVLVDEGGIVNSTTGSVAGLNLSIERKLDLYVADPGHIGWRVAGFVLEIETLDGKLVLEVQPYNIYEANYLY